MKKLLIIPMLFICSMVIGQSKKIIGKPIKIENLEVAQHDFLEKMNLFDAKAACTRLGKDWRLPTKDELNVMYKNKDKIGGFANGYYWSSTEDGYDYAWKQTFNNGSEGYNGSRYYFCNVRAVRTF